MNTPNPGIMFDIGQGEIMATPEILEGGRIEPDAYNSRERFEAEREMFGKVWLNIAEAGEIPNPDDWIVRDVTCRSVSAIIVRGKDMNIRAFHNICSHRGMKLVWDEKGRGGKFSCPYHAWQYNTDGELTHIPDAECFPHVDKQESGLTPIHCDTWEGFIFINLDQQPAQTLVEFLGPMTEALKNAPFQEYPTSVRCRSVIKANWKLGVEAQSESYHAAALHARTVAKMGVTSRFVRQTTIWQT
ncbi:Phenylpropionate dioxygenase-like ring-hydroxylating dioxygenase large terminal subunit [Novosphingobium lubricantis]|uniref:Phenylpropionate dioxygenase-like ring-hydroxylating dioxygenase large terminal subunit n=1 Tax=Sphingobium fontiphilum TaxID=944425 RepID=A0A7W6DHH7_9SPHN|nr:Rieske (2Fe-2S) protein [Sphingobium fontiphilum]MBB3983123.1 phenylpropionate dioxygenase-like ring-hydroxylating dioxygenase large terminal subunit [Sphingobium fontiphilum]